MKTSVPNGIELPSPAASSVRRMEGPSKRAIGPSKTIPDTAFGKDLHKLMPLLSTFSVSLCRDRELAKDLAQEAICKAWQARNTFRHGTNLKAWLFTILRNLFYSYRRRAWRQTSFDGVPMDKIRGPDTPQEWAVAASEAVRALHMLSDDQRQAVILVGMAGLAYADAALVCGCRIGTLKSRVARARQALLAALRNPNALSAPRPPVGEAEQELMRVLQSAQHG